MASTSASAGSTSHPWPAEPSPPVGYLSRKALPIKRQDAEPLTREDVQFDLLHHIFSNSNAVFTSPVPGKSPKVTFAELYVSALYNSSKCSKVLREKMVDTPPFAIELAKISLLTNVGRINTTMAFFPEMKTALRTYHPVPSLQKTDGNAQDAPRIKNCLKAALLPSELKTAPPSTPEEILEKCRAGQRPPTTIVNLVFVLANHAAPLASVHFDGVLNFLDLFLPNRELSSADRSRAFLWLAFHYLENPDGNNPFDDDHSRKLRGKAPFLHRMTETDIKSENVDTPEEIAWGKRMSNQRNAFLQKLVNSIENDKKTKASAPQFVAEASGSHGPRRTRQQRPEASLDEAPFMYYVPQRDSSPHPQAKKSPLQSRNRRELQPRSNAPLPISRLQPRTMLQHAWHVVNTVDPLVDSDDETEHPDEHVLHDYTRRMGVLSQLNFSHGPNRAE
ncbi:Ino eighty subunit 1 [Hypsizygus marmoreus]|uniref:Ino eighty subunit 1 n=1 Tax=Hypsizygus marmoreus TaxID=39966 RepID=A0A369KBH2_HYPMA|nr:Ino eighty subunit 1 [Hypsizygus marmoreus]